MTDMKKKESGESATLIEWLVVSSNPTVGDVVAILADPPEGYAVYDHLPAKRFSWSQHYAELSQPRTRGSTSEVSLADIDPHIGLEDVTASVTEAGLAAPGCRYYRGESINLGGRLGAMTLADVTENGWLDGVSVRDGSHGYELVMSLGAGSWLDDLNTGEFHVIVGPADDGVGDVIYTWYPGPVMGRGDSTLTGDSVVKIEETEARK